MEDQEKAVRDQQRAVEDEREQGKKIDGTEGRQALRDVLAGQNTREPQIGDKVWYRSHNTAGEQIAFVTHVHSDTKVDVSILPRGGGVSAAKDVEYNENVGKLVPNKNFWRWPLRD